MNPPGLDPAYKSVDTSLPLVPERGKEEEPLTDSKEQDLPKKSEEQRIDVSSTIVPGRKPPRRGEGSLTPHEWVTVEDKENTRRGKRARVVILETRASIGKIILNTLRRKRMWVFLSAVILITAIGSGLWLYNDIGSPKKPIPPSEKDSPPSVDPKSTEKPVTTREPEPLKEKPQEADAKREAARVLALGALRYCTDLSVAVSKLPKMEKILEAAQKLYDVSSRYQPDVDRAKKMLEAVREDRNKHLMACMDKMTQLSRYGPDPRAYAVQTIKNSDLFPREKIVWNILESYEQELSNGKELDPKRWLSDFSGKFSNFVE